jgi:hypothetical protein
LLSTEGFLESIERTDCFYDQLTNIGTGPGNSSFVLKDATGTPKTFWCFYMDQDAGAVQIVNAQQALRNDYGKLRSLANGIVRENNKHNRSYTIGFPTMQVGMVVGMNATINGQGNYVPDVYAITSVSHDCERNRTAISLSNVKPPKHHLI